MVSETVSILLRSNDTRGELIQERPCRKVIVTTVALIAIGALTFALLSYFGVIAAGSVGTICLFTIAGVTFFGLVATVLSSRGATPVQQSRAGIQIGEHEVIFTNHQGVETRKPIFVVPDDYQCIVRIKSPHEVPQLTGRVPDRVLVRDVSGEIWPVYSLVTEEGCLSTRSATTRSLRELDDSWRNVNLADVCDDLNWVEVIPYPICIRDSKLRDVTYPGERSLIHWDANPYERYRYAESGSKFKKQVSILGSLNHFKSPYRIVQSFYLHAELPENPDGVLANQVAALLVGPMIRFYQYHLDQKSWQEVPWSVAATAQEQGLAVENQLKMSKSKPPGSNYYMEWVRSGEIVLSLRFEENAHQCEIQREGEENVVVVPFIQFPQNTSVTQVFERMLPIHPGTKEFAIIKVAGKKLEIYSNTDGEGAIQPIDDLVNVIDSHTPMALPQ